MSHEATNVFLVGAGPGDPGLITVRGLELIRTADVVLHDRLVDPRLVDEAPAEAERVFVGKTPGGPSMPQAKIDALIVERARTGRRVVRLKGGDPFVFGRGADEAQALVAAGIAFEIVPGVTSAIAVPAYAGIPVTHSGASSSFAVVTAHESAPRPEAGERWIDVVRGAGTLVLLMGVSGLEDTVQRVIAAGRDPDEPAAVIERGTTRSQRTVVAPLSGIGDAARSAGVESPAITVVGPVVRLRDALSWFESKPLFGRRVVVTRPSADTDELRDGLQALGAEVESMPLIAVLSLDRTDELDSLLGEDVFEWVGFSSHNAVFAVVGRLRALDLSLNSKVAAVGPKTAAALEASGIAVDLMAQDASGAGLAEAMGAGPGTVLVPTSAGRSSRAADELQQAGWEVARAPAYRTVAMKPSERHRALVESGDVDALLFASGSAVEAFVDSFPDIRKLGLAADQNEGPRVVAVGPSTAATLEGRGIRVDRVAEEPTSHGLTHAILDLLGG